jgi:hypothetical protein
MSEWSDSVRGCPDTATGTAEPGKRDRKSGCEWIFIEQIAFAPILPISWDRKMYTYLIICMSDKCAFTTPAQGPLPNP